METWNAFQIAWSNGAYAGKTVKFMDPKDPATAVTGELGRTVRIEPDKVLVHVIEGPDRFKDGNWYQLTDVHQVEVH